MNTISVTIIIVAMTIWMIVSTSIINDHRHEIKTLKDNIRRLEHIQLLTILKDISEDEEEKDNNNDNDKEMTDDTIIG